MQIRNEKPGDEPRIRALHLAAFEGPAEADMVDALRTAGACSLSQVAAQGDAILGHILYSPATVHRDGATDTLVGLAPMAVSPEHQRKGIGTALICGSLEALRKAGHRAVVVVGHPEYYPLFGFEPGADHGLHWEGGAPHAFFVRALQPDGLKGCTGEVRYRPEIGT